MLKPRYLVGFSGHRTGFDEALIRPALKTLLGDLQRRAAAVGGEVELYASVAEGADTVCVEVARELSIPVHLLLPLSQADFEKDFSSPQTWERSRRQMDLATQKPCVDSMRVAAGEITRPDCYYDQGIQILEAVDLLIAIWDGDKARGLGGTEQIVTQAGQIALPRIIVDPQTGQSRVEGDLAAAFAPDKVVTELNEIARRGGGGCSAQAGNADDLQQCLDSIANTEAGRFRPSIVRIILLHGIAALMAAWVTLKLADGSAWEKWKWVITAVELALVSYALWLGKRLHDKHTQERWIRCRFAAELVRGFRASVPLVDPLAPSIAVHDPKWRRFALSTALLVNASRAQVDTLQLRDDYIATRLSEMHPDGQIGHYLRMNLRALRWWTITGQISQWSARLAPPFVFLSLLNKLSKKLPFLDFNRLDKQAGWHLDEIAAFWPFVVLLPIALPLLAGVSNGIRQALDAGRRKERYPEMVKRLTALRIHLSGLKTRTTIARTVAQSEEILLDELREWQLTAKTTGH